MVTSGLVLCSVSDKNEMRAVNSGAARCPVSHRKNGCIKTFYEVFWGWKFKESFIKFFGARKFHFLKYRILFSGRNFAFFELALKKFHFLKYKKHLRVSVSSNINNFLWFPIPKI